MGRRRDLLTDATPEHDEAVVARALQRGLAPDTFPTVPGMTIDGRYRAGGIGDVGGDWYDVLVLPDGSVALVIGDVAGHGISAATTMGQLRHATRAYLLDEGSPGRILGNLNRLTAWLLAGEVATAAIAVVSPDLCAVTVASAGHPPLLQLCAGRAAPVETSGGPALGLHDAWTYADFTLRLAPGEGLLLYTDGLVERRGEPIDAGLARLAQTAAAHCDDPRLLDVLVDSLPPAVGDDDLAVLRVVRVE